MFCKSALYELYIGNSLGVGKEAHRLRMLVVMEVPGKRSPQASTTLEELRSSTCAVVRLGCSGVQRATDAGYQACAGWWAGHATPCSVATVGPMELTSCVELVASGASSGAKPRMTSDRQSDVCTSPCHI